MSRRDQLRTAIDRIPDDRLDELLATFDHHFTQAGFVALMR